MRYFGLCIFLVLLLTKLTFSEKPNTDNAHPDTSIYNTIEILRLKHNQLLDQISILEKQIQQEMKYININQSAIRKDFEGFRKKYDDIELQILDIFRKTDSLKNSQRKLQYIVRSLDQNTEKHISDVKTEVSYKFLLLGGVALLTFMLIGISTRIFRRKNRGNNLTEESIKLDAKMSRLLENQLILMNGEKIDKQIADLDKDIDHSLPVSVGSEIFRMRKRIAHMDEKTPGLHALTNALNRLEDEFKQQGYVIKDMTGQPYVEGMTVKVVNVIKKHNIESNKQIISKMITPQIYYNDVVVSHGEVEIAVSSKKNKAPKRSKNG